MVNAGRVKRKLLSLLVDDCSNRHKQNWNEFMRTRNRISNFRKHNPARFNTLTNKVTADLNEIEKAVSREN